MPKPKKEKLKSPLPMRNGVSASRVWLPPNHSGSKKWHTVLDFLVERFPFIGKDILYERMQRNDIVDQSGKPYTPETPYKGETFLFYYREIPNEPVIPFKEKILFKDEHIIVVDKPHFIPVTPGGRFVKESLLVRLKNHYQQEEISPIHRLDRETAGIVLFSCNRTVRGAYQNLFQNRQVQKIYQAIAPIADYSFPITHKSYMVKGEPFFIMKEEAGIANSETEINLLEKQGDLGLYQLKPLTGKQHQLRVHMMSLGIPILNDPFYPVLLPDKGNDYSTPLQLLAQSLTFIDPITGEERSFQSERALTFPV